MKTTLPTSALGDTAHLDVVAGECGLFHDHPQQVQEQVLSLGQRQGCRVLLLLHTPSITTHSTAHTMIQPSGNIGTHTCSVICAPSLPLPIALPLYSRYVPIAHTYAHSTTIHTSHTHLRGRRRTAEVPCPRHTLQIQTHTKSM